MKYQILGNTSEGNQLALHVGIQRVVEIWQFPTAELTEGQIEQLVDIGSRLASVDHPCLPHLIDFREAGGAYEMIFEADRTTTSLGNPKDAHDLGYRLERLSDALSHAHQRGLAHGNFSEACVKVDSQGELQLHGVGQLQAKGHGFSELVDVDRLSFLDFARPQIERVENCDDEAGQPLRDLSKLAASLSRANGDEPQRSLLDLHQQLQRWLEDEIALREQQSLAISESTDAGHETVPSNWTNHKRLVTACVVACLLLCLLVVIVLSRPGEKTKDVGRISPKTPLDSTLDGSYSEESGPQIRTASEFDLEGVGVFNANASSVVDVDASTSGGDGVAESGAKNKGDSPALPSASDSKSPTDGIESRESGPEAMTNNAPAERDELELVTEALKRIPTVIDLPRTQEVAPTELVQFPRQLSLSIKLLGGRGAYRDGTYVISTPQLDEPWRVSYQDQDTTELASLERNGDAIMFRWLEHGQPDSTANHLRNVGLQLVSGMQTATVALRSAQSMGPLPVNLQQGIVRHKIEIDDCPSLSELHIEFVPREDGLAIPISPSPVAAADGELRIALDAGEQSLFFVQVNSLLRKRRAFDITPYSRPNSQAKPLELKKGTIRQLENELQLGKRTLYDGKLTVNKIKDKKRKKLAQVQLSLLERRLEVLSRIGEAFSAAQQETLSFRIFRRVEDCDIVLLHIGDVP